MSITSEEIKAIVQAEDDFGHELRVGSILRNVMLPTIQTVQTWVAHIQHGGSYTDDATSKTRQFDYRCRVIRRDLKTIALALECKNLNPDLPLVVCGRPRTDAESYHVFIEHDASAGSTTKRFGGGHSIYKPGGFVGKSLMPLKKLDEKRGTKCAGKDSEIYDRWSQALSSSRDLAWIGAAQNKILNNSTFILPLVVVPDDTLWIANYNENGTLAETPAKTDGCQYFVEHRLQIMVPYVVTHIHFVTCNGLSKLLSQFLNDNHAEWDEIFNPGACPYAG